VHINTPKKKVLSQQSRKRFHDKKLSHRQKISKNREKTGRNLFKKSAESFAEFFKGCLTICGQHEILM